MTIEDEIFDKSYTETLELLGIRFGKDSTELEVIREELNTLYIYEGLDWTGRGEIKNAEIRGSITAYQVFLNKINKAVPIPE